jgi:sugar phosphate isomerase/epimerase
MPIYSRRSFIKSTMLGAASMMVYAKTNTGNLDEKRNPIRLGGPVFGEFNDAREWIAAHERLGYSAAYFPLNADTDAAVIRSYTEEAQKAGLIIAEVGAWSNPISPNEQQRKEATQHCMTQLALADKVGANCCVNIAGSRDPEDWDGPHAENLTADTFDMIVEVVRAIIDQVQPVRTFYTLETMPYIYPDSIESYLKLIKAIDRNQFAVHLDPVNLINSPERYYKNSALLKACFAQLGPYIKSCHAKDVMLKEGFPVHIQECRPGLGYLDYSCFLQEASRFQDLPLMLEHLKTAEEYATAADYLRDVATNTGFQFTHI